MTESTAPQTPEEEAARRALEGHRRPGYDAMATLQRLIVALLVKDIRWSEWQGRVKCLLWLAAVLGLISWGLVRLDESSHELARPARIVQR